MRIARFVPSLAVLLTSAQGGCSADESRPPEFRSDAKQVVPRKCEEVRKGTWSDDSLLVEGSPAGCAAPGMSCPVFDVPAFASACAKGTPVASCVFSEWKLVCELDAGILEAGPDADDASLD